MRSGRDDNLLLVCISIQQQNCHPGRSAAQWRDLLVAPSTTSSHRPSFGLRLPANQLVQSTRKPLLGLRFLER